MSPLVALALLTLEREPMKLAPATIILTYHDFVPVRDRNALWFDCTPTEFEQQLNWLTAKGVKFISLQEVYARLSTGKKLAPKTVALTFADNYQGFYRYALPILRKRHIPATMFVHTGYVGSKVGRPKMTWSQLKELDQEGLVKIESQTVSHPADITILPTITQGNELRNSKGILEANLRRKIKFLAYPNGKFDLRVADMARKVGYLAAFTEELKPAESTRSFYTIPRWVHTKYRAAYNSIGR